MPTPTETQFPTFTVQPTEIVIPTLSLPIESEIKGSYSPICIGYEDEVFIMVNNSDLNFELLSFILDLGIQASRSTYNLIWNNSLTAIHRIYSIDHIYMFIANFGENEYKKERTLYWVDKNCFLPTSK